MQSLGSKHIPAGLGNGSKVQQGQAGMKAKAGRPFMEVAFYAEDPGERQESTLQAEGVDPSRVSVPNGGLIT